MGVEPNPYAPGKVMGVSQRPLAPAPKALQGLKGPPAAHKVMPYKALQK